MLLYKPVMPRFRFCRCFVLGCDKVGYQWRTLCEAVGLLLKDLKVPYYVEFIYILLYTLSTFLTVKCFSNLSLNYPEMREVYFSH